VHCAGGLHGDVGLHKYKKKLQGSCDQSPLCLLLLLILNGYRARAECNNCIGCKKYTTDGQNKPTTVSANVAYASTCVIRANADGSCTCAFGACSCDRYKVQLFDGSGTEISGYTQGPTNNFPSDHIGVHKKDCDFLCL